MNYYVTVLTQQQYNHSTRPEAHPKHTHTHTHTHTQTHKQPHTHTTHNYDQLLQRNAQVEGHNRFLQLHEYLLGSLVELSSQRLRTIVSMHGSFLYTDTI